MRRRYSDFEYLVGHFARAYPYAIIPPIPDKQSLNMSIAAVFGGSSSSTPPSMAPPGGRRVSHDAFSASGLVDHRIRTFQSFLCHTLSHPILSKDHALHLFVGQADAQWRNEILNHAEGGDPVKGVGASTLTPPYPKSIGKPFEEILGLLPSFEETLRSLESAQKTVLRRSLDILKAMETLGTSFNGFSLEYAQLAPQLELTGELYDEHAMAFGDTLLAQIKISDQIHEAHKFVGAIKRPMRFLVSRASEYDAITQRLSQIKSAALQHPAPATSDSPGAIRVDSHLAELEAAEARLAGELADAKASLMVQLNRWMSRVGFLWSGLLLQLGSAQKSFCRAAAQTE